MWNWIESTNLRATASDWQNGSKFRKVEGEFSGGWVYSLLEEKCYHTIWKVFRGLLLAIFVNDRFSNVKLNVNVNVKQTWQTWFGAARMYKKPNMTCLIWSSDWWWRWDDFRTDHFWEGDRPVDECVKAKGLQFDTWLVKI